MLPFGFIHFFQHCNKIYEGKPQLNGRQKIYFSLSFWGFHPCSADSIGLGPVVRQDVMVENPNIENLLISQRLWSRDKRREWGQGSPFLSFSVWLIYTSSSHLLVSTNISAIKSWIHQWVTRLLKHSLHNLITFQSFRQLVLSLKLWPSGRCFILTSDTLDITGKIGVKAFWSWEVFSSQVSTCNYMPCK